MTSWVDQFMTATIEAESPRSYFWWSGLAAISAVVSNKVWLNKQIYKLHPNLYILLIGKSGLRKSGPPALIKQIVEKSETVKTISGRASIQAIVKELGQVWNLKSGKVLSESTAFICSTEFSSSLVGDDDALTILTDLHDSHYHPNGWRNILKTAGVDTLEHPCLTLLSATNQTHFDDMISQTSMFGGFIARTILVIEEKKSRINDLLDPPEIPFVVDHFVPYLRELSKVSGEMKLTSPAKKLFRDWYATFGLLDIEDKTGTSERLHDRILKVAMNLSLAEDFNLTISECQMQHAMDVCIYGINHANKATIASGKSEMAPKSAMFIDRLFRSPDYEIDRKKLLSLEWGNFDSTDLNRIVETLEGGGIISSENRGGKVYYKLEAETVEYYKSVRGEK